MAIFGEINPHIKTLTELLPPRGPAIYASGNKEEDKGIVRYAYPSSKQPILTIVDPIYDNESNVILAGYYELVLSEDRQMLLLTQSQKIIAKIPVFKVEIDRIQEQAKQPKDSKSQRKFEKEKRKKEKRNKKRLKEGKIANLEPKIYMNASIQYDKKGDYYLIKYECGKIRAWGAIK